MQPRVLLEVNVAGEGSKLGFAPEIARADLESLLSLARLTIEGLMTIPPLAPGSGGVAPLFCRSCANCGTSWKRNSARQIAAALDGNERRLCDRDRGRRDVGARGDGDFRRTKLMRIEPKNLQLIGDELAISWNDGAESFLPAGAAAQRLSVCSLWRRTGCARHVMRPHVHYTAQSFELRGWALVGGYAVQPVWGDGHNTGIYSYQYLRRLALQG